MYEAETIMIGREDSVTPSTHPDMEMAVNICVDDPQHVYVFHDQPFKHELSWIEYDVTSGKIDFIMEDGDLRNFGIAVERNIGKYLQNNHVVCVAYTDFKNVISDIVLPLVTHH